MDVLSDLMIMALPLRLLKDLQVTRQQKIGLGVVFSLGFMIIATAIVRMTQIIDQSRSDPVGLGVWGLVESSVAVIVGSLPPLKSFFAKKLKRYVTHHGYGYGGNTSGMSAGKIGSSGLGSSTNRSQVRTECIPLDEREGSGNNVVALKGQIVVEKSYGWARSGSVSDAGSAVNHVDEDEERGFVGMAVSDDPRVGNGRTRMENKEAVQGKTWLRTSVTS